MIKPSPPFWENYRQLQHQVAACSTENTRSRGDDDSLTALLDGAR